MSNPNFDTLLSTTLDNYRETLTDNVFNSRPVLFHLMEKNRLRMLSGGNKIVEPLIYDEGQAGSYGEWEQLTITPQDGITAAEFDWKSLYATIAISGLEEAKNSGEEQVISLLEAKTMQAEQTLKNKISTMLFAETLAAATDWSGLGILIGDHNSTVTSVGGIDCATVGNEYWRSIVRDKTATAFADVDVRAFVAEAANSSSDSGTDRIDAVFTAQDVFELYESQLTPQVRYSDVKSANAGFQNLMVQGVPMYWDFDCPAGTIYGVNSKYIGFAGHTGRWFQQSPFSAGLSGNTASAHASSGAASTVDARYSVITAYGNMTVRNRKRHFKIHDVATS
ncbi:MAG: phage major capsid protein [Ilumatobacteraceae bacterium]